MHVSYNLSHVVIDDNTAEVNNKYIKLKLPTYLDSMQEQDHNAIFLNFW
jgi:hypothetical protein